MTIVDTIYDRSGIPTLRVTDRGRLLFFDGQSAGFLYNEHVYDYNGSHRGWYEKGILRDHSGHCVGFGVSVGATPHPILPIKRIKPIPGISRIEPIRSIRAIP